VFNTVQVQSKVTSLTQTKQNDSFLTVFCKLQVHFLSVFILKPEYRPNMSLVRAYFSTGSAEPVVTGDW